MGRVPTVTEQIRISEIFGPTIQGEGLLIGKPTVFVRTGGCDYRCAWCDTLYAVLPEYRNEWALMSPSEIMARVDELSGGKPVLISLSGGNPALQPLDSLISLGRLSGHSFAMETQGSVAKAWFACLDWLILSPKPPSSGTKTDWSTLADCIGAAGIRPHCVLKIVVFDDTDYDYAKDVAHRFSELRIFLQVGNPVVFSGNDSGTADLIALMSRFRWLIDKTIKDRWFDVTVLPQLHVLTWGNRRGV